MSYTNNEFNLLNIQESTGGGGSTTIIQQTTDANLFYTKTATDALLNSKANNVTLTNNYYDRANIDGKISTINTAIATKANNTQLDNYYTKTQTDNLLTSSTVNVDLSNYYDKANIDGKISTINTSIATLG